jgi:hypothetical protein
MEKSPSGNVGNRPPRHRPCEKESRGHVEKWPRNHKRRAARRSAIEPKTDGTLGHLLALPIPHPDSSSCTPGAWGGGARGEYSHWRQYGSLGYMTLGEFTAACRSCRAASRRGTSGTRNEESVAPDTLIMHGTENEVSSRGQAARVRRMNTWFFVTGGADILGVAPLSSRSSGRVKSLMGSKRVLGENGAYPISTLFAASGRATSRLNELRPAL